MAKRKPDAIQEIWVDNRKFPVNIFLENRNNSRVSIAKSGVLIRLPKLLNPAARHKQISQFRRWAEEKIRSKPRLAVQQERVVYLHDQLLKVGLFTYRIFLMRSEESENRAKLLKDTIVLDIDGTLDEQTRNETISWLIYKVVASHQKPQIVQRILKLNARHFQKPIRQIRMKNNTTNWGSCSGKSNINISARLLFAPEWVQDYVCLHELAHLIEPNHSHRFWNLVGKVMPDYKQAEKWLKENSHLCRF